MNTLTKYPRTIDNFQHPLIKRILRLRLRDERQRTGLHYAEGIRFVEEAVRQHADIETLVVCYPLLRLPFAQKLVRHERRKGTSILEVTPNVMYGLGHVEDPQGIGVIVRQQWEPLTHVKPGDELCWIALQTVRSPGNLGSILRTSDAVGGAGIILLDSTTDPYDPATVRASMGAMFRQRFVRTSIADFRHWKKQSGYMLVGTSPAAEVDYHAIEYHSPTILVMGEERKGLNPELQSICDVMVSIPMMGKNDSLNLAIATSVMLYELFNQQRGSE